MLDFSVNYSNTKFIVLENNYRSSQGILDLSVNLIENNSERLINRLDFLDKKLIAQSDYKDLNKNSYFILQDEVLEKIFVLDEIKKKNKKDETFAIILRSNKEVEAWTKFMQLQ
jgi:superfamily I DNA/RNA helicase